MVEPVGPHSCVHCHGNKQSDRPAQTNPGAPARDTGRPVPHKTTSEAEYNRWFCATVNGETETRHGYTSAGGRSFVKVDCETSTTVYEGGLDKRSSLDSLQCGAPVLRSSPLSHF